MRHKNLIDRILLSILVSSLFWTFSQNKAYTQDNNSEQAIEKIQNTLESLNTLKKSFGEVNYYLFLLSIQGKEKSDVENEIEKLNQNLSDFTASFKNTYNILCTPVKYSEEKECENEDQVIKKYFDQSKTKLSDIKKVSETLFLKDLNYKYIPEKQYYANPTEEINKLELVPDDIQEIYFVGNIGKENKGILNTRNIVELGNFFNDNLYDISNNLHESSYKLSITSKQEPGENTSIEDSPFRKIINNFLNRIISQNPIFLVGGGLVLLFTVGGLFLLIHKLKNVSQKKTDLSENKTSKLLASGQLDVQQQLTLEQKDLNTNFDRKINSINQQVVSNNRILTRLETLIPTNNQNQLSQSQFVNLSNTLGYIVQKLNDFDINQNPAPSKYYDDNTSVSLTSNLEPENYNTDNLKTSSDLDNLISNYNHNAKSLANKVYKVAATRESIEEIRSGINTPLILKEDSNDSYWVISEPRTSEDNYYLVPKANLIINELNYQTAEDIFICEGYENRTSKKFQLIHPAEVKFLGNNQWKPLNPGKLRFKVN